MYTIYDYLEFYKNKNSDLNDIDYLLFSILSYLPIKEYTGKKNLKEFIDYSLKFKNNIKKGSMAEKAYELLDKINNSSRYSNLKVYNPVFIKNDNTQFGALTFRIKNKTIISYKGTDGSYIGWIENFRIGYKFPTYTQELALKYLEDNTNLFDRNIYLVGHSKGGNLAITSLYLSDNNLYNRIKKVYNFDGPGLRYKEFTSDRFNQISYKIINYIPSGSMVGVLMDNKEYNVIKSNELAWKEHYPTSWQVFGEFFIPSTLSNASKKIHDSSTKNIRHLEYEKMENAFEQLYTTFGKEYDSSFRPNLNDFKRFFSNMKSIDPEIAKYLENVFNSLLNIKEKNK